MRNKIKAFLAAWVILLSLVVFEVSAHADYYVPSSGVFIGSHLQNGTVFLDPEGNAMEPREVSQAEVVQSVLKNGTKSWGYFICLLAFSPDKFIELFGLEAFQSPHLEEILSFPCSGEAFDLFFGGDVPVAFVLVSLDPKAFSQWLLKCEEMRLLFSILVMSDLDEGATIAHNLIFYGMSFFAPLFLRLSPEKQEEMLSLRGYYESLRSIGELIIESSVDGRFSNHTITSR